jgi:ankyrin repeat protein
VSATIELRINLHRHIKNADLPAVRRLLDRHGDDLDGLLNTGGTQGDLEPPLVQAAGLDSPHALALAKDLLAAGAPVDLPAAEGVTALFKALELRNLPLAQLLLDAGASPHAATSYGVRVFDKVLATGDMAWVQRFLDDGHTLDHTSQGGNTSLHWAARSNNLALYERVREHTGLAPDLPTRSGYRPVDLVSDLALFQHMRAHCPGMAWDVAFKNGDHSLHLYAVNGAADIIRMLLAQGLDPNLPGQDGNSPLHNAASGGDLATVQALLAAKAKPSARNSYSFTPLHWAAELGRLEVVRCLVEHKAKLNAKGNVSAIIRETPTPLYLALREGHGDVARYLLAQGADPNVPADTSQRTALYQAAGDDDLAMCALLLDHGASPNGIGRDSPDDFFSFPLEQCRSAAMVDLLVGRGADVAGRNTGYETALHAIVRRLDIQDVRLTDDEEGQAARRQGLLGAIAALLRHGADPKAATSNGLTPLSLCKDPQAGAMLAEAMKHPARAPAAPQPATARQQAGQDERRDRIHSLVGVPGKGKAVAAGAASLGAALYGQCKEAGKTQAELDGIAESLARADRADAEYISEDSFDNQASTLHRLLYAARRSGYDTRERPPVSAWQPLVARLLDLGSGSLNHVGGVWRETPLHTLLRAALYSEPAGSAAAQAAVDADYRALAALLLQRGAKPDAGSVKGVKPLDLAREPGMARLLREHGARAGSHCLALFHAIEKGDALLFEQALACEPPLEGGWTHDQPVLRGCTALLFAAMCNRPDMLRRLARLGASTQARTQGGLGPLHMAAWHGSVETLQYLVAHAGLDINALDAQGIPALHYLVASRPHPSDKVDEKTHRERVRGYALQLAAQGARTDIVDRTGEKLADLVPKSLYAQMERAAKKANAAAAGRS